MPRITNIYIYIYIFFFIYTCDSDVMALLVLYGYDVSDVYVMSKVNVIDKHDR